ncbi:MAG: DUF6036 family nucleotidyltransferase [Tepidisphaeraceae bacterium]
MATSRAKLDGDFKAFLESLNSAKIRYLVLGGYAVNYYGYHRSTDDLDVWVAVDSENAHRLSNVLQSFGGFRASEVPSSMFIERGKIFMFGRVPWRVDVLTGSSGIEFEQCYSRRVTATLDGVTIPVLALEDLRANKLASGRNKDLADLDNLPKQWPEKSKAPTKRKR